MPLFETKWIEEKIPVFIWRSEANETSEISNEGPRQREKHLGLLLLEYAASSLGLSMSQLDRDDYGKPYFAHTPWEFSITHTRDFLAAVFHPTDPVGIDLERPQPKIQKVLPRICTTQELDWAGNDPVKQCFLWSAKEAMYKLYGKRSVHFKDNLSVFSMYSGEITMPDFQQSVEFVSYLDDIPGHVLVVALPK